MTRSLKHLLQLVENLEKLGVSIISLRENIDTSTATGRCFISIIGAISQMERELKSERAKAGREAAKARGRSGGRPRTDPQKLEQAGILHVFSNPLSGSIKPCFACLIRDAKSFTDFRMVQAIHVCPNYFSVLLGE